MKSLANKTNRNERIVNAVPRGEVYSAIATGVGIAVLTLGSSAAGIYGSFAGNYEAGEQIGRNISLVGGAITVAGLASFFGSMLFYDIRNQKQTKAQS